MTRLEMIYTVVLVVAILALTYANDKIDLLTEQKSNLTYQLINAKEAAQQCSEATEKIEIDKVISHAVAEEKAIQVEKINVIWKERIVKVSDLSCQKQLSMAEEQLKEVVKKGE